MKQFIVISRYHSGVVRNRTRSNLDGAHRSAAWDVEEGAYRAEILRQGASIGTYEWRGGLTYIQAEDAHS